MIQLQPSIRRIVVVNKWNWPAITIWKKTVIWWISTSLYTWVQNITIQQQYLYHQISHPHICSSRLLHGYGINTYIIAYRACTIYDELRKWYAYTYDLLAKMITITNSNTTMIWIMLIFQGVVPIDALKRVKISLHRVTLHSLRSEERVVYK